MIKRGKSCLIGIALLFASFSTLADRLIIEPEMGRQPLIEAIDGSHQQVKLVMYGFTDEVLLKSLLQKTPQTLQIILEKEPYKAATQNHKAIKAFKKNKIAWQGSIPPYRLIHQKTMLIDNKEAIIMTFNFTKSAFKKQRNFALVVDDAKRVNNLHHLFSADWNHLPSPTLDSSFIVSPNNARSQLLSLIQNSKQSLQIYAQSITDYKIIDALANAAKKGVKVEILTSNLPREKQHQRLASSGVKIKYSKHYYIHAKVIIVDNKKAIVGSINLTRASLDQNRELAVMTKDSKVIKELTQTFYQDWHQSELASLKLES